MYNAHSILIFPDSWFPSQNPCPGLHLGYMANNLYQHGNSNDWSAKWAVIAGKNPTSKKEKQVLQSVWLCVDSCKMAAPALIAHRFCEAYNSAMNKPRWQDKLPHRLHHMVTHMKYDQKLIQKQSSYSSREAWKWQRPDSHKHGLWLQGKRECGKEKCCLRNGPLLGSHRYKRGPGLSSGRWQVSTPPWPSQLVPLGLMKGTLRKPCCEPVVPIYKVNWERRLCQTCISSLSFLCGWAGPIDPKGTTPITAWPSSWSHLEVTTWTRGKRHLLTPGHN